MISLYKDAVPIQMLPGITRRTLVTSQALMICEFIFEAHAEVPIHTHPQEQVGYLVEGRMEMTIDGVKTELKKGDSYCAPANIRHGAFTLEPSVIVDTFYPPREDYR